MPRAIHGDLHVDQNLTQVAINYRPKNLIADKIAPIVKVAKQSDYYPVWSQADIMRVENANRARGAEANKITRAVSSGTYYAENYALKTDLTLEDRVNMDAAFVTELRAGRARFLTGKMGLVWESRVANQVTSGSNVGSYTAVASAWTDYTTGNSDPVGMIWTGIDVVQDTTGYRPNAILMGSLAWRNFRKHADVIDLLHGDSGQGKPRYASRDQAAQLFEVDKFLVGEAFSNTSDEGQSTALSPIWGDHVLIYYVPEMPTVEEPSFMYTFRWAATGLPSMTIERHPFDSRKKTEEIEIGVYQDEVITSSVLSYLITNVTSSS
jgi:hypothetical protein